MKENFFDILQNFYSISTVMKSEKEYHVLVLSTEKFSRCKKFVNSLPSKYSNSHFFFPADVKWLSLPKHLEFFVFTPYPSVAYSFHPDLFPEHEPDFKKSNFSLPVMFFVVSKHGIMEMPFLIDRNIFIMESMNEIFSGKNTISYDPCDINFDCFDFLFRSSSKDFSNFLKEKKKEFPEYREYFFGEELYRKATSTLSFVTMPETTFPVTYRMFSPICFEDEKSLVEKASMYENFFSFSLQDEEKRLKIKAMKKFFETFEKNVIFRG